MADTKQTTQTSDPQTEEKTQEQYLKEAEQKYIVPGLVREKFPDLIKLIYETESMNTEEREYWLQIMPIMTEDQIVKFRDILVNEKQQLEKLDQEYKVEMDKLKTAKAPEINEKDLKARMAEIRQQEVSSEEQEQDKEAELLSQLQDI